MCVVPSVESDRHIQVIIWLSELQPSNLLTVINHETCSNKLQVVLLRSGPGASSVTVTILFYSQFLLHIVGQSSETNKSRTVLQSTASKIKQTSDWCLVLTEQEKILVPHCWTWTHQWAELVSSPVKHSETLNWAVWFILFLWWDVKETGWFWFSSCYVISEPRRQLFSPVDSKVFVNSAVHCVCLCEHNNENTTFSGLMMMLRVSASLKRNCRLMTLFICLDPR